MAIQWQYSDWRDRTLYPDIASRHARLAKHIEEVSSYIIGVKASEGGGSTEQGEVSSTYLTELQRVATELETQIDRSSYRGRRTRAQWGRP